MKNLKLTLACISSLLAIASVVGAKEVEKKRATYFTAYYYNGAAVNSITTDTWGYFDDLGATSSNQATIQDHNGTTYALYANQALTTRVKFYP